jgi:hypothetical protein
MTDPLRVISTIAYGPDAPAFRVRTLISRSELRRSGVDLTPLPLLTADEDAAFARAGLGRRLALVAAARRRQRERLQSCDAGVALIHRHADLTPSLQLEREVAAGRRLVYDVDDPIWLSGTRAAGGHRLAGFKAGRRKARWLASKAAHVIAGNEILAEWLGRYSDQVTVVPSVVETREADLRLHDDRETVVLGWIGSHTTAPYLAPVIECAGRIADVLHGRRLKLLLVGVRSVPSAKVEYESLPWSVEAERRALAEMDIGVMPLPNNPWTRAKCAYKAIQYMAAGVPVIADDVGITRRVVGDAGLIPGDRSEWGEAVVQLATDVDMRRELGRRGRKRAERDFSVERWSPVVARILQGER